MNRTLFFSILLLMPPTFLAAAPSYILENNEYHSVSIDNSLLVPTYRTSQLSGIDVLWHQGVFYAKRQGLIIKILKKNVEPALQNLSRSEIEKVIKSNKPIRIYRNAAGEYNIEYLLVV